MTVRIAPESVTLFRIDVEDTGVGIAPAQIGSLFIEFQQLDAGAAKKYQGTGLGLALTKRLVEAHGGRVAVRSTPGQGSTFSAILPRVMSATPADAAGPVITPGLGNRTVLVVDDDPAALKLAEATLRELRYEPVCVCDPEEALRSVAADPPAAIVLDLLMPHVNGFEFLSRLRATAAGRQVPIVVWTVKDLDAAEYSRLRSSTAAIASKTGTGAQSLNEVLQRVLVADTIAPGSSHGV